MIRILESKSAGSLLRRRAARLAEAETTVRPILEAVRKRGDAAVLEYARRFDNFQGRSLTVAGEDLQAAWRRLPRALRDAMKSSAANIRAFAKFQLPRSTAKAFAPGRRLGQVVRPLDTVAAYIPGGRYPLPSTLLMTVIPAQVAGVANVCVTCPRPVDAVLGAAAMLKLPRIFRIGGAHAIAAFAYGTRSVPKADRIVGPGNIYVAAAKKIVSSETGIDFVAGPTEVLIISDAGGNPRWLAADMLAQAEHDVDASAILVTTSKRLARAVAGEIEKQLADLPSAAVARPAIERNSGILIVESLEEAAELANRFAPEHLSLPGAGLLGAIRHAGSIFIGPHSPEAAADYSAGPNHVLPTSGMARFRAGLSVADYVKVITTIELAPAALRRLAPAITTLARAEGLEAHARSVEARARA